jgi:hypothetical protein
MKRQKVIGIKDSNQLDIQAANLNAPGLSHFGLNPFRVLRLPVDATSKQVLWQAEKVLSLVRLKLTPQETDLIPWLTGNTEIEIKQAVQKLEEPLQRIVEQLLWFDISLDPKGNLLQEGFMQGDTRKLWDYSQMKEPELSLELISSDEVETDTIQKIFAHCINKANIYLILALSEFHSIGPQMIDEAIPTKVESSISKSTTWGKGKKFSFLMNPHELVKSGGDIVLRISYWKELWTDALNNWYKILTNPHFSSYLKHIFNKLGDEMLDEGAIETIRQAIPQRLTDILVGEIKNALGKGAVKRVSILADIVEKYHLSKSVWDDAFDTLRFFFQTDLSDSNSLIENNSILAIEDIEHYFKRIGQLKQKWEVIDPNNKIGLLNLIDDALIKGLEAVNSLDYYSYNKEIVERSLAKIGEIAYSKSVIEKINIYRIQILELHQYAHCYFCGERNNNPNYPLVVLVKKKRERNLYATSYSIKSIIIPRCENCTNFHQFIEDASLKFGEICSFLVIISITGFRGIFKYLNMIDENSIWLYLLIFCFSILTFIGFTFSLKTVFRRFFAYFLVPNEQKPFYKIKKFKTCLDFFADGYSLQVINSSKYALKRILKQFKQRTKQV